MPTFLGKRTSFYNIKKGREFYKRAIFLSKEEILSMAFNMGFLGAKFSEMQ